MGEIFKFMFSIFMVGFIGTIVMVVLYGLFLIAAFLFFGMALDSCIHSL